MDILPEICTVGWWQQKNIYMSIVYVWRGDVSIGKTGENHPEMVDVG